MRRSILPDTGAPQAPTAHAPAPHTTAPYPPTAHVSFKPRGPSHDASAPGRQPRDQPAAKPELHLVSLVLHVVPRRLDAVRDAALAVPGAEIHAATERGKLVVTLEGPTTKAIQQGMAALQMIPGVMAATLVYQHAEPLEDMNEEIPR